MPAPDDDRLIDIIGEAMRRPPPEREAYVRAECPAPDLRAEALSLLEAAQSGRGFPDPPSAPLLAALEARAEAPGQTVGRYRLLELIGEGGFGRVFLAEQREPVQRRVAVKFIKAGMDTAQVVARFEAERQALAVMDHPGIATVLDGGATDSGRPYVVMELVRGVPITSYCDARSMPVPDRLALFREVCAAVQHAHQKGVIHRDLKPGNILVAETDGRARPKIIDFGIAKAVGSGARFGDHAPVTEIRQFMGTPEYMSPEQAIGAPGGGHADVDTRTDIYSLGVILYELLTGTTPLDRGALRSGDLGHVQRLIREAEAPRPSTRLASLATRSDVAARRRIEPARLRSLLRGDLDWIVLKAIEKDRDRRYDTAAALAEDVRRFLDHEPVSATPPSAAYRVRKFMRRHRAAASAGSLVVAAIVLGLGVSVWQARVAARERDAARTAAAETRRVAEFQAAQLRGIEPFLMGARLREDLAAAAREAAERPGSGLGTEDLARLDRSLAAINLTSVSLRVLDRNIFDRAIRAANDEFAGQPVVRAGMLLSIGETMIELGLLDGATAPIADGLALRREHMGDDHEATIEAVALMGHALLTRGTLVEAEVYLVEALDRSRRVLGEDHPLTIDAMNNMGRLRRVQDRNREAEAYFREAVERNRRVRGPTHERTVKSLANLASALGALGRSSDAEAHLREAAATFRGTLGDDHPDTLTALGLLAIAIRAQGRLAEAEPLVREVVGKRRRLLGDDHPQTLQSLDMLGDLLRRQIDPGMRPVDADRIAEAESVLREVLERRLRRFGSQSLETLRSMRDLGALLLMAGQPADAEPLLREATEGTARLVGEGSPLAVMAHLDWARALAGLARFAEAESHFLGIASGSGHGGGRALCAADLASLYEAWDRAEPGKGYDAKASRWRDEAEAGAPGGG